MHSDSQRSTNPTRAIAVNQLEKAGALRSGQRECAIETKAHPLNGWAVVLQIDDLDLERHKFMLWAGTGEYKEISSGSSKTKARISYFDVRA